MDWNFGWDNIIEIVLGLMAILGVLKRGKSILREWAQAMTATSDYIEDPDRTMEECQEMVDEWYDVYMAARGQL